MPMLLGTIIGHDRWRVRVDGAALVRTTRPARPIDQRHIVRNVNGIVGSAACAAETRS
jgi:hypothetical protein